MEPVRVIVVDDAADTRFLVGLLLRETEGVEVVAEADGADAALAALGLRPDVALVDARMPGIDGFELTGMLRERAPELLVVVLTSLVDDVVAEQARAAGATDCWSKGEIEGLGERLKALVRA